MKLAALNLQHGQKTDGTFDFTAQVDAISSADVVCVQERSTTETGWNTPLSNAGMSEVVFKSHLGSPGDGNAIWMKNSGSVTLLDTYTVDLAPTGGSPILGWDGVDIRRGTCAVKVRENGKSFYVVSTHFVSASGEDNNNTNFAAQRVTQIESLLSWANSTLTGGLCRIYAGDDNFPPGYPRAPERTYTADSGTNVLTSTGHGFTDGMAVALRNDGGAAPSPLVTGTSLYATATVYWVRDATSDTFKLAASRGGEAIDLTTNGTGTNFVSATQYDLIQQNHYDLWHQALLESKAFAPWDDRAGDGPDMPLDFYLSNTHDTRRIDHAWMERGNFGISLVSMTMPDVRAICDEALVAGACPDVTQTTGTPLDAGIRISDHVPLIVELAVTAGALPVKPTQFSWNPLGRT